jgi:integrase
VRAKVLDPRTGKKKEVDRIVEGVGVTVQDAVRQRATWIESIRAGGEITAATRERKTFSDFASYFVDAKRVALELESVETYASALNAFASLGDVYLDAITTKDVQDVVQAMVRRGQKPSTVRGKVRVLRSMFRFAMRQSPPLMERDPTLAVTLPKLPRVDDDDKANQLTGEELARALRVAERDYPEHYAMLLLLACTGIRFTHVSALKWDDVDFEAGVIHFRRKQVEGRVASITTTKRCPKKLPLRDASKPELQLLEDALRQHRRALVAAQHPGLAAGWCFPNRNGSCDSWERTQLAWARIQEAANIARPCTLHGLRHTFNDLTRHQGIDPLVIRSITQHTSDAQREHYSAVNLGEKANAMNGVLRIVKSGDRGGDQSSAAGGGGEIH